MLGRRVNRNRVAAHRDRAVAHRGVREIGKCIDNLEPARCVTAVFHLEVSPADMGCVAARIFMNANVGVKVMGGGNPDVINNEINNGNGVGVYLLPGNVTPGLGCARAEGFEIELEFRIQYAMPSTNLACVAIRGAWEVRAEHDRRQLWRPVARGRQPRRRQQPTPPLHRQLDQVATLSSWGKRCAMLHERNERSRPL